MEFTVKGTGLASAKPEFAVLSIGVETIRKTAKEAREAHKEIVAKVNGAITTYGIKGKDIEQSRFTYGVNWVYNRKDGVNEQDGFKANSTVSVRVRDFEKMPDFLDSLTAAGATSINGPDFTIENTAKLLADARTAAFADAKAKAMAYVEMSIAHSVTGTDKPLVIKLVKLEEEPNRSHGGGKMAAFSNVAPGGGSETLIGETQLEVNVECTFSAN